ncbi:MAG: metal-sensing transcriptional repressor [Anaerolineae bacterium]
MPEKRYTIRRPSSQGDPQRVLALLREAEACVHSLEEVVEEGAECAAVLERLAEVRATLEQAALTILEHYLETCLSDPAHLEPRTLLRVLDLFLRLAPVRGKVPR